MSERPIQPLPILTVLEEVVDQVLGATQRRGHYKIPAGGYMAVDWLSRKGCYRVTIDVMPTEHREGPDE